MLDNVQETERSEKDFAINLEDQQMRSSSENRDAKADDLSNFEHRRQSLIMEVAEFKSRMDRNSVTVSPIPKIFQVEFFNSGL
jgi:hypothetical protein